MRGTRIATFILLMHFAAIGWGDETLVYQGSGFMLRYPRKHTRLLPAGASVAFSMEYRESCFLRVERDVLLQPIDLADRALANIFLEIQLSELRERIAQDIGSYQILRFGWGNAVELVYHLPSWNGRKEERDKVVEVLATQGSTLFRFLYWVPEKELEKCEPVMRVVIASFRPQPGTGTGNTAALHDRGRAAEETGDLQSALEAYAALVESEPTRVEERFRLAVLLRRAGRPDDAIRHYLQILDLDPTLPRVYYNLAVVHLEDKNEPERAESYFRRFLDLAPESEKAEQVANWLESRGKSR